MGTFARFKDNPFARVAVLFLFLLAIGLLTRAPAHALSQFYGLHGVLSAPLFAALATWHLDCRGRLWQLLAAVGIIAALLGMMNLVMGVSFLLLALGLMLAYGLTASMRESSRWAVCGAAFGALSYPCTVISGVLLGSYAFLPSMAGEIVLLSALSLALGALGSLAAGFLEKRARLK